MQITINIPEDIGHQLQQNWQDLPQKILESIAIEAYRNNIMNLQQVQQMLQFSSLSQTEHFLNSQIDINKHHETPNNLNYHHQTKTLAATFQELQKICIEEDYCLEIPARQNCYSSRNIFGIVSRTCW